MEREKYGIQEVFQIWNTFLFLFSTKEFVIMDRDNKMLLE